MAKTGKVDVKAFKDLQSAIDTTATDTQGLITQFKAVGNASIKMGKSVEDAFGAGIQDALDQAGVSVKEFEGALKKAAIPAASVKKELMALKNEMAKLKAEGKDTGKEFDALRARAGKLSDAIADANAEIKNAGSDTRNIDNVVGSISALAGGYAAVQGAAALFGEENEDLQKALLKVNGAMALATGLQQVMNALQKEGALVKLADTIQTKAQAAAMTLYTFVTTGATVAARAYRVALLATGIGAVIVLVLALVTALNSQKESMEDVNKTIEDQNSLLEASNKLIIRQANLREESAKAAGKAESELMRIRGQALVDQFNNITLINKGLAIQRDATKKTSEAWFAYNKQIEDNKELQDEIAYQLQILNIQGTAQVKKELGERIKAEKEFNDKKKAALEKALKDAEDQRRVADANYIKLAIERVNKEIEAEQIKYDNIADMDAQLYETKKKNAADWERLHKEFQDSLVKSSEDAAAKMKAADEDRQKKTIKNAETAIAIAERVASVFNTLTAAQTAKDNAMINSKRREVDELLRAGAITAKAAEARQKQIDKLEARAKQQQAEREKKAAVFQAVLSIPKAFLQGLSQGGIYLAAVYAALAAVEAAVIISQPVPKFFRGKKDNYAGPGVVGDMGSEIVERDGRMFLYTKPTQTYLGAKDKVYTAGETKKMLHNTSISTTIKPAPQKEFDYVRFAKAIPANAVNINIDKDFITESVAKGLTQNKYMDRRYSSK